jgi:DNA-binding protein HU-beta
MNKAELTKALARSSGLSQAYAGSALQAFQDVVIAELRKGGEVNITGFGKFSVTERAERDGINPATGAKIRIAASRSPRFKPGKTFKDAL